MSRRSARERQRGAILISVMVFMALLLLFTGGFVNHVLSSEAQAVEELLADTRAYWAMNGHVNYMLSRASQQGLCHSTGKGTDQTTNAATGCSGENDGTGAYPTYSGRTRDRRVGSMQDYLDGNNEIQSGGDIDEPGTLVWYFPQNFTPDENTDLSPSTLPENTGNPYRFAIRGVVSERLTSDTANDGQMRIDLEVTDVGEAVVVRDLDHRVGRLTMGFCVMDIESDGASPPAYSAVSTLANCGGGTAATDEGKSQIQFILRNFPFDLN